MRRSIAIAVPRTPHPAASALTSLIWLIVVGSSAAQPGAAKPSSRGVHVQSGTASYFGAEQVSKKTASGAPAKPNTMTAASRSLPLGTTAKVVNTDTGKATSVTVVDRGPYAKHRLIDVSAKAATKLGMKKDGVAHVKVQPLHVPNHSNSKSSQRHSPGGRHG